MSRRMFLAGLAATCLPLRARAAEDMAGVTATELKIGNTSAYSGPASAYGIITRTEGAVFKMINDQGGVGGRKIVYDSLGDGYSPPKTVDQVRRLVEEDQVAFLCGNVGTASNTAIYRYTNGKGVPLLFLGSGAAPTNGAIRRTPHG